MNGAEFFMRHAGYRLLLPESATDDPIADAETLFTISLPQYTGKTLRLSSCWMVVASGKVVTSFKAHPSAGFDTTGMTDMKTAVRQAADSGEPFMFLQLGKRTTMPRDLFVTYDPRALRICRQGETETVNMKESKQWTS